MLEHVRQSGASRGIVHRAHVRIGVEGHHRGVMALDHQKRQAVAQRELRDFLFEILEALGGQEAGE